MGIKSNQKNISRSKSDKLIDIAEMLGIVNKEDVIDIENLATEVEHFWFTDDSSGFNSKFPQFIDAPGRKTVMHVTEEDKDLLTHYYGTALSQKKEGTMNTLLAGLFHELRGYQRGHTIEDTISDLVNNFSSLSPDFTGEQEKHLETFERMLYGNPDDASSLNEEDVIEMIEHAKAWTMDPPTKFKYYN